MLAGIIGGADPPPPPPPQLDFWGSNCPPPLPPCSYSTVAYVETGTNSEIYS